MGLHIQLAHLSPSQVFDSIPTPSTLLQTQMKVFTIGASRGVGYYASVRLLGMVWFTIGPRFNAERLSTEKGATITFLLRSPAVFDNDDVIKPYVQSGHARIVQGDGLNPEDVARAWASAQEGPGALDLVLFTLGKFAIKRAVTILTSNIYRRYSKIHLEGYTDFPTRPLHTRPPQCRPHHASRASFGRGTTEICDHLQLRHYTRLA